MPSAHLSATEGRPITAPNGPYGTADLVQPPATFTTIASTPGATTQTYRCPTGSPAKSRGTFVSKRPLIAGCMLSSDTSYDPIAEVHVPAFCAAPADFHVGCMLPAGTNFDPTARQSGNCIFPALGCTIAGSVNFNPAATVNDGSCIATVVGCTVHETTYHDVETNTPNHTSGFHGNPVRWIGKVYEADYTSLTVTNYDANANVNHGCIVAIEGCMDSSAVNYDPEATINGGTWCVPRVEGCMMPGEYFPSASLGFYSGMPTPADGGNKDFNMAVTVHNVSACRGSPPPGSPDPTFSQIQSWVNVARFGCMDSNAVNYDAAATNGYGYPCHSPILGCLNPLAVNFGCENRADAPCSVVDQVTGLHPQPLQSGVAIHSPYRCKYPGEAPMGAPIPPSPPPPAAPTGGGQTATSTYEVRVTITTNMPMATVVASGGGPSSTALAVRDAWESNRGAVDTVRVTSLEDGSTIEFAGTRTPTTSRRQLQAVIPAIIYGTRWDFVVAASTPEGAAQIQAILALQPMDQDALAAALATIPGITVTSDAEFTVDTIISYSLTNLTTAAAAGLGVGLALGIILIGVGIWYYRKRQLKVKEVYPA